jgi:esterase
VERLRLHYKRYGRGSVVVLLHGLFGAGWHWSKIIQELSHHYEVIVPDLRNHGSSPCSKTIDYVSMADDVKNLLYDLKIEDAIVVGHSMGGKVALQLAATDHQLVKKIVVTDIAPRSYSPRYTDILQELWKLSVSKKHVSLTEFTSYNRDNIYSRVVELFLTKNFPGRLARWRWIMQLPLLVKWYRNILKPVELPLGFSKPVLFIRSATSGYISTDDRAAIQRTFRHARMITVHDAGHWLHVEAPSVMVRAIKTFCKE